MKNMLNLPRKWYSNQFRIELEVLESFIDVNEDEIDSSLTRFYDEVKTFESKYGDEVDVYKKIDSYTFNIEHIVSNHFPDLKRKSNFVLIISDLEINFISFCNNLNKEFGLKSQVKFRHSTFSNIGKFLTEDLKIPFSKELLEDWEKLKFAYNIRNKIIHNNQKDLAPDLLKEYCISDEFIFSKETNIVLFKHIHSFFFELEKHLLAL